MKKIYVIPRVKQETAECCTILASSGGVIGNNGIGYGGVDDSGDKEPSVKEFLWDDSEN